MIFEMLLLFGQVPVVDLNELPKDRREAIEDFHHENVMLPAVCSSPELQRLQGETYRLAKVKGQQAWDVARTMFCGTSKDSKRYLGQHMPHKVTYLSLIVGEVVNVGDELVARSSVEMLQGRAWETDLRRESEKLVFEYTIDGLCRGSFALRYVQQSWLLVQVSEGCI